MWRCLLLTIPKQMFNKGFLNSPVAIPPPITNWLSQSSAKTMQIGQLYSTLCAITNTCSDKKYYDYWYFNDNFCITTVDLYARWLLPYWLVSRNFYRKSICLATSRQTALNFGVACGWSSIVITIYYYYSQPPKTLLKPSLINLNLLWPSAAKTSDPPQQSSCGAAPPDVSTPRWSHWEVPMSAGSNVDT